MIVHLRYCKDGPHARGTCWACDGRRALTPFALRGLLAKLGAPGIGACRRSVAGDLCADFPRRADDHEARYCDVASYSPATASAARTIRSRDDYPEPLRVERAPDTVADVVARGWEAFF